MTEQSIAIKNVYELEQLEVNLYRGQSKSIGSPNVFGGQVLGQALMAASLTVDEERTVHSMHAYFLRPGNTDYPIIYDVERIRDGRSFTTRRVVAIQKGKPIFNMAASYQITEGGLDHQFEMPKGIPMPEDLPSDFEIRKQYADKVPETYRKMFLSPRPVDMKSVTPMNPLEPEIREPVDAVWLKSPVALPDDQNIHRCVLAYASDFGLMGTAMLPHGVSFMNDTFQGASIDHAMWFHRDFRADEWLLYYMDSDSAQNARGITRGKVFSRDGVLVASTVQEGLMRAKP